MITHTTTMNEQDSERATDFGQVRPRINRRRRVGPRAFVLGATMAAICVGGAWIVVDTSRGDPVTSGSHGTAAAVSPATTSTTSGSGSGTTATTVSYSPSIASLQRDLAQLNYYEGPIDGIDGPETIGAVESFQRANGLTVDGIAGPETMAKIDQQLVTGDNQMGPSGPPVKPADITPAKPANTTPSTSSNNTPSNSHNSTATGGSGTGSSTTGGAGTSV